MAGDIIDRAYLDIDGAQVFCDSIDIEPENDSDWVTAMTPDNNPLGVRGGNDRFGVSADITMRETEEVNFDSLWQERTIVKIMVEFEGGSVHTYQKAVVTKSGTAAKHGEEVKRSIELNAWDRIISG